MIRHLPLILKLRASRAKREHMGWEATSEGIKINKLFGSKELSYADMKSIRLNSRGYVFTTKDEEEITLKSGLGIEVGPLYEALAKYNISYIDENEAEPGRQLYDIDEVNSKAAEVKEYASSLINPKVKEKFGEEYDIDLQIEPVDNFIDMYFCLRKNGEGVQFFEAFDDMVIAFLVEWEAGCGRGKYGLTVEADDREACAKAVEGAFEYLCEHYK